MLLPNHPDYRKPCYKCGGTGRYSHILAWETVRRFWDTLGQNRVSECFACHGKGWQTETEKRESDAIEGRRRA